MDKQSAIKLIRETFDKPFDKERFVRFVKELFNRISLDAFEYYGQYIPDSFKPYISKYERIGKYKGSDDNRIDVLVVYLEKEKLIERARTMQRNFIAGYLAGKYGSTAEKKAALVAFISLNEEDWRFSLVKMEYKLTQTKTGRPKGEEEFTPAKRFSFLVGKNEPNHTAQSRLYPILKDVVNNPTLTQLEDAFNIEIVTKEFFERYRDLFIRIKEAMDSIVNKDPAVKEDFTNNRVDTVNFAKKLMGQIVFLYFLQKKGWFGVKKGKDWGTGSKRFLRDLYEGKIIQYENFFNDVLEPLFYDALARDRSDIDHYNEHFKTKIPFLNGGLFDPINNYSWVNTDILLPDELFSNSRKTKQGDIGDGILDIFDRYNFTVREDEPLEKEVAIDPELLGKAYEKFNAIRPDNYDEYKKALRTSQKGAESKFNKQYGVYYTPREIVHYMCQQSLINYLVTGMEGRISKEAIEFFILNGEKYIEYLKTAKEKKDEGKKSERYKETEHFIELKKHATDIDNFLSNIKVCDPAIGSGAFPVGMMTEIVKARLFFLETKCLSDSYLPMSATQTGNNLQGDEVRRNIYNYKRDCIQNSLYGVDIDTGAVEIAKLRLWLSLVVDEEDIKTIKPLPNLDYKIMQGNTLLSVEKDLFNVDLFNKLEELKPLYFNEANASKKKEYKNQVDELIRQITNGHKDFDFEVYFSEVFHEKKGFDVVIANPPYGADLSKEEKKHLDAKFFKYRSNVKNSAIYFIYIASELINEVGINSFIVPKSLCYSAGWNKCANVVRQGLQKLIDTGKAFEEVKLEQVIFVRINENNYLDYVNGIYDGYEIKEFTKISKEIFESHNILLTGQTSEEMKLIYKIIKKCNAKWGDYVSIERGLNWQSKATKKHGLVPIYRGAQLSPYFIGKPTDFIDINEFNRNEYKYQSKPKILNQLAIAHVQNPYPHFYLQATLDLENKLVFETISCTFVEDNSVSIKFLLAINNSKLFSWLLYKFVYSNAIRSTRYDEQYVGKVPCFYFEETNQESIIHIVDQILAITKDSDYLENPAKQAKVREYEKQIDQLVYKLYSLMPEEIKIVEGS